MGNEIYRKTVKMIREQMDKTLAIAPVSWGTIRLKLVYGSTEERVRRQLVSISFCGRRIWVHRKVVASLDRVEARIRKIEREKGYRTWVPERIDTFNWRPIRGGTSLSHHSFGIALDIDPADNPMTARYDAKDTSTIPVRVIDAFRNEGWTWGGTWNAPCDPMHMQRH